MSQLKTTMRLTIVALVAGALTLPGTALAGRHGKHGHGHHDEDWDEGWHGHGHGHWGHDRDLVVIREPVYVRPRPRVVVREPVYIEPRATVVAPMWQPPGLGLNLFLPLRNW